MKKLLCLNLIAAAAVFLTPGCAGKKQGPQVATEPAPGFQEFPTPAPTPPPLTSPLLTRPAPPPAVATPAVVTPESSEQAAPVYVYEQKPISGRPALMTQDQAQTIIDRFKEAYPKLGSPKLLIYVNRELVDEHSAMKLLRRTEQVETTRNLDPTNTNPTIRTTSDNTYRNDAKPPPTLADKQTVRDVERLFGRPLRAAGATLVDQKVATELIADKPIEEFVGAADTPQARKDREALGKVADAVIEILISSRTVNAQTVSGDQSFSVPDIQATAINLKDSKILAQVSATDVTGRVPPASLAGISVPEITEATALALMEDMIPQAQ